MNNRIVAMLLIVSLLTSMAMVAFHLPTASAANENVKLYIDPSPIDKSPDDINSFFDVYVTIANVTDLFGFDINITWINTLITLNSYDTTFLDAVWPLGWFEAKNASGVGTFKLAALSTGTSFTKDPGSQRLFGIKFKIVKACNFNLSTSIHFNVVKLSNSLWTDIPSTQTDGLYRMSKTIPGLEFEQIDPTPTKPYEYCKNFNVRVYVTHICAQLNGYDLTILYTGELLNLTAVDWTGGVLGGTSDQASSTGGLTSGTINVVDTGGSTYIGDKGLLFTLAFHIEFDDSDAHIWRNTTSNVLLASISFADATLSFIEGTIPMSGITIIPLPDISVHLIRGDVVPNGKVEIYDLVAVAHFYDQYYAKYDLKVDGIIDIFDLVIIATNFGYPL